MEQIYQFIKFEPILKEKLWGGEKLMKLFNKKSSKKDIGESWEISDIKEDVSIVANGSLKGLSLSELVKIYQKNLVGNKVYKKFGQKFPLLIKFIDANKTLSLQVHPDEILAMNRHQSLGKTEMWYVLDSDEHAKIIVGFSDETNEDEFLSYLKEGKQLELLNIDYVKKGDAYFVPAGRIHAIGAGVLLAEIQETSDITYRVSDWERKDKLGNSRELHLDLAIDTIDYSAQSNYKENYNKKNDYSSSIVGCQYFTTNFLKVTKKYYANHMDKDSFVIYMCVDGEVEFIKDGERAILKMGETLLVPACLKEFIIIPQNKSELLEVYIK